MRRSLALVTVVTALALGGCGNPDSVASPTVLDSTTPAAPSPTPSEVASSEPTEST
jgi:outer membrane lipoprotein SlyB